MIVLILVVFFVIYVFVTIPLYNYVAGVSAKYYAMRYKSTYQEVDLLLDNMRFPFNRTTSSYVRYVFASIPGSTNLNHALLSMKWYIRILRGITSLIPLFPVVISSIILIGLNNLFDVILVGVFWLYTIIAFIFVWRFGSKLRILNVDQVND